MPRYGRAPWIDRFPKSRVPNHPRFRGTLDAEVVIIGGGLTGCATAYACAAAGVKVLLLEAERIGRGGSSAASGWLSDDPGVSFVDLERAAGRRVARGAWQAWRRAALDLGALVRRLGLRCDFEPRANLTVAATPEQAARLSREHRARRDAGFEAALLSARAVGADAGFAAAAGLRTRDGATLDPYRATLGLASAAVARGAQLFERSPVTRTRFGRRWAEVRTEGGSIRTGRVIVATGSPTPLFKGLMRHFWFKSTFLALTAPIPAKVRKGLGRPAVVVRDQATPPHLVRWVGDDRLLVTGADGARPAARLREQTLVQRTGQLMYELSTLYPDISGLPPEYGWEMPYALTADGLPYIGPHRNYPHHLFAWGDAGHGVTGAYLASRILLRYHMEATEPADALFGFLR